MLVHLLEDGYGQLAPELTTMLKAKLCRRLAKLEMDKNEAPLVSPVYNHLFDSIGPLVKQIIKKATEHVEITWANFKKATTRRIPKLPSRADEEALRLSLFNSKKHLLAALTLPHAKRAGPLSLEVPSFDDEAIEEFQSFTDGYFNLAKMERNIESESQSVSEPQTSCQAQCLNLAQSIDKLFNAIGSAYDANPEQMSTFILNLFDLWVQMDKCAIEACPLLRHYRPSFSPELLDVLHLPTLSVMQRLRDIQLHLKGRSENCRFNETIFSEPDENCFAAQYLEQYISLQNLGQQIEADSTESRERKKTEWTYACEEYDRLSQEIFAGTCVCSTDLDDSRNIDECTKCYQRRCRKRMEIKIHEDFLPQDRAPKAAVLFELEIPNYFAAYRDVTWRIIKDLAHPSKPNTSSPPVMLLEDYSQLKNYSYATHKDISLASATKSFLQTHFSALKMKVDLSQIFCRQGLSFSYYDTKLKIWLKDLNRQFTFQHHCGIHVPRGLQFSVIESPVHPAPSIDGPSSYEIIASQTKCPSSMSIHEFTSYQKLLSGKFRRWPTMLVELGASNLNFSIEDTMRVFSQLAVQAGPAQEGVNLLRDVHLIFRD